MHQPNLGLSKAILFGIISVRTVQHVTFSSHRVLGKLRSIRLHSICIYEVSISINYYLYVGFFPSREIWDKRSEDFSWGLQWASTITDHSTQKFCSLRQWSVNNIVALIWVILCGCKFDRSNWTKEEEKNSCKTES